MIRSVTVTAPINIALIKYWGKRDEELLLPTNSSLSATLHADSLYSRTTATASPEFKQDSVILDDEALDIANSLRLTNCFKYARELAQNMSWNEVPPNWKIHVSSHNRVPTAAGLASSASGYAALVYALAVILKGERPSDPELVAISRIARMGSGSACRSIFGGFVKWHIGSTSLAGDSHGVQLFQETHWPELRCIVCMLDADRKLISSTCGMRRTVETSRLFQNRRQIAEERILSLTDAIAERDFEKFAEITMQDSNQFHALCLDSYPPIFYLSEASKCTINAIHEFNQGKVRAAYTFDAGPNAFIFVNDGDVDELIALLNAQLGAMVKSFIVSKIGAGPSIEHM